LKGIITLINNPWLAGLITLIICLLWMRVNNLVAKKNIISSSVSRKIIHIGTGPVFLVCWLLFPEQPMSRYLAAVVPFLIVLQLGLVGLGWLKDDSSIKAMARTGGKNELLKGPFFYGIVFVLLTVIYWNSVNAIIPLMILCGGDGLADLIGSKFGSVTLPWNKNKTVIGSLAMFFGGFILSLTVIAIFISGGVLLAPISKFLFPLALISLIATFIESITPSDYDNITVPAISLIFTLILL
jgi:phytol kinase